ncbi:hypothetical protein [Flavobacterium sp. H122]|uniref:hypothetical protein n=1 Tax=Flavobacterium sp. H122 TaxID=2529860 RepID=UPI0010AAA951|nr:hypothetical protein [Flavobacterium sp. H122]
MKTDFYKQVEACMAYRADREKNRNLILRKPEFLPELITIALNTKDKNHFKAFWVLELVCEKKLKVFTPFIDEFCEIIPSLTNDSAIRSASRICLFLAKSNHRSNGISLTQNHETQIIETCFDWLIRDEKVAAKVYAMRALFVLGKKHDWVHPEIKTIIQQDYSTHSAAYQAATRMLLKKLKI